MPGMDELLLSLGFVPIDFYPGDGCFWEHPCGLVLNNQPDDPQALIDGLIDIGWRACSHAMTTSAFSPALRAESIRLQIRAGVEFPTSITIKTS